ncbi:MAG: tRNA threonylcarbamoyladenosine dehydratase [Cardiobacteriaceae bacterium]|nr:tRNA threonylcarbamoyladenosine dehydratase [Cardiobacteriaceae bacterium]
MPHPQARTEILLGADALAALRGKSVMVAGLGGVGGYCAEALVRGGVGRLVILDHDTVAPSNLNRQLLALHSTLGARKTAVMADRLRDINPDIDLVVLQAFLQPDGAEDLLDRVGHLDFLADCIDSIACKAALVRAAQARGIAVMSAMGAGNRFDVSRTKIKTLNQTSGCPLAREMRKRLKELGADLRYPVVFSDEPRRQPLPHQAVGGETPGRPRAVNGTISYLPAQFGIMMAGHILHSLIMADGLLREWDE